MIYLFFGPDTAKARAKWREVIRAFGAKNSAGEIFQFDPEHFDPEKFEELISGADLFGNKRLVALDHLLESEEWGSLAAERAEAMAGSANTFLFLETEAAPDLVKRIQQAGGKTQELVVKNQPVGGFNKRFNIFSLSDALAARDRKRLWVLYQEALRAGFSEEDIFWKFAWQIKTLLLVKNSPPGSLKTVKDYTAGKARAAGRNFPSGELEKLSGELVAIWHEARRGAGDFDTALEKFVLSI